MIIVLKQNCSEDQISGVVERLENLGLDAHISRGELHTIIGVIGDEAILSGQPISSFPGVKTVVRITKPYKLASREGHPDDSIVQCGDYSLGSSEIAIIAGPGTVESEEQALRIAEAVQESGACCFQAGVYQPRISPYSFKGLGKKGLQILSKVREQFSLPILTEVLDSSQVEEAAQSVDMLIIGAQNMQNYELLQSVAAQKKPVLLMRGVMNTIEEFLLAAEFLLSKGNTNLVLCESGIRTFEKLSGYAVDIRTIPFLKKETHLPIMLDVSHATSRDLIEPTALAAIAAGVDGLLLTTHDHPEQAMSKGESSIIPQTLNNIVQQARAIRATIQGRR